MIVIPQLLGPGQFNRGQLPKLMDCAAVIIVSTCRVSYMVGTTQHGFNDRGKEHTSDDVVILLRRGAPFVRSNRSRSTGFFGWFYRVLTLGCLDQAKSTHYHSVTQTSLPSLYFWFYSVFRHEFHLLYLIFYFAIGFFQELVLTGRYTVNSQRFKVMTRHIPILGTTVCARF